MKHPLEGLPFLLCKSGAYLVGGCAKFILGNRKGFFDFDFIVPPEKWCIISLLIPKTAKLNRHGGLRFIDKSTKKQVDIWPCSVEQHLRQCGTDRIEYVVDFINQRVFTSSIIKGTKI